MVKNPPANAGDVEMWVKFLSWEDPLEKGIATHSSYKELDMTEQLTLPYFCILSRNPNHRPEESCILSGICLLRDL